MKRKFNDMDRQIEKKDKVVNPTLKNDSLLRICPDCGRPISYYSHFGAYMHSSALKCAYMESPKGKRVWDDKMRSKALESNNENEAE